MHTGLEAPAAVSATPAFELCMQIEGLNTDTVSVMHDSH